MKLQAIFLGVWFVLVVCVIGADDLTTKCAAVVTKVTPCLNFATGTAAAPTKECCDSATSIKESNPECLCFIIQQIHKGSPEVKSMGIQESRLLQLPSACNLKNASISNCPSKYYTLFILHIFFIPLFYCLYILISLYKHRIFRLKD